MRKGITYSDAVRLLGQESKVAKVLSGALLDATPLGGALSLFDVKDEAVRLGTNVAGQASRPRHRPEPLRPYGTA
ncbi:hypothetical protein ACFHYQ_22840 [Sphaerimonospora cavernae]|uniref:NACHT N-terminal Helical domain-containing protein n=1 Tax=Sphaerimonospora cavernae TaxID=1740611 RepID=A0ABV6UAF7_9ACTN